MIWSAFRKDNIMIMTLLDVKVILKVSVTDGKSLTSGEVRIHKYFCLYNTLFSLTCYYKIFSLPKAVRLLKTLFPFNLKWESFSKSKYKKLQTLTS